MCMTFLALSCSKDLNESQTIKSDQSFSKDLKTSSAIQHAIDLPIKGEFNVDVSEFIQMSDDEVKLDYLLYYAADALKEIVLNPSFNQSVIDEARKSPNETANVLKLTDALPELSLGANQTLQSRKSEIQDKTGLQGKLIE